MKKALKRLAAIILVLVVALGSFGFSIAPESGQALMSGGGAANHEFIKPVTHQTAAPDNDTDSDNADSIKNDGYHKTNISTLSSINQGMEPIKYSFFEFIEFLRAKAASDTRFGEIYLFVADVFVFLASPILRALNAVFKR